MDKYLSNNHNLIDTQLFQKSIDFVLEQEKGIHGIGTLREKTIHSVLKYYYAPKECYHEHKIGSYVADILLDGEIYEIQTRSFNTMRKKLDFFLKDYDVTIVYPIAATKWLRWIDMETGELSNPRKSPKKGSIYQIIMELYKIKQYLNNSRLHFILCFIDVEESRLLNGWSKDGKKGSTRNDGMPLALVDEVRINFPQDYRIFLPSDLPEHFTSKDYKKLTKTSTNQSCTILNILFYLGLIKRIGKKGNSFIYEVTF